MIRFDLLKQTDTALAASLILMLAKQFDEEDKLQKHLETEITEAELQQINAAAQKEGRQPLSLSRKQ